ncbi:MAG: hypothetical protein OXT09_20980, partial [Myxococcales bacterium]|nr:hypothetical protein [Myxococcales bacterium]
MFALYIPQYFPDYVGGGERLVQLTAAGLTECGEDVTIITGGEGEGYEVGGIPVRRVPMERGQHWTELAPRRDALAALLAELEPKVLQTTTVAGLHVLGDLARQRQVALGMAATEYGAICEHRTLVRPAGARCAGPTSLAGCFTCGLECGRRRDRLLARTGRVLPAVAAHRLTRVASRVAGRPFAAQLDWWRQAQVRDARRRHALSSLVAFITPTPWTRDLITPHLSPRTQALAIMHPLPDALRTPGPKATPQDALRVGFVGRPLPFKGLHVLLEAIESLAGRAPVQLEVHAPSNQGELGEYWRPQRAARPPRGRGGGRRRGVVGG